MIIHQYNTQKGTVFTVSFLHIYFIAVILYLLEVVDDSVQI